PSATGADTSSTFCRAGEVRSLGTVSTYPTETVMAASMVQSASLGRDSVHVRRYGPRRRACSKLMFLYMADVLVFQRTPAGDEHPMGIVLRPYLQVVQVTLGYQRAYHRRAAPVDGLPAVIAEILLCRIDVYRVRPDGQHRTG